MINNNLSSAGGACISGTSGITGSSLVESALIPQDAIYRDVIFNVKNYPSFITTSPFCCWKQGKIPYNPVTGKKARVDDVKTFGSLDDAYRGYMANRSYKGIGLKVSGKLGAIDLDKCVISDDVARDFKPLTLNSLSENAQKVLKLFPNAVVELSPSRTGLHLFFIVPTNEGNGSDNDSEVSFTFDRDDYYINNRKLGMEIYFADSSNRFLTVTGNIINTLELLGRDSAADGSEARATATVSDSADAADAATGIITAEALQEFLDTFMKRPTAKLAQVQLPEGGSILSDEEVIEKASHGKNGERFKALFEGDWLSGCRAVNAGSAGRAVNASNSDITSDVNDINWSHSEADIALCGFLAFYCRADMAQMDRLFRSSGLYRDKWDRAQNGSTYGVITMTNAIANCKSFYDPKSEWEQRVAGYKALIDKLVSEAAATTLKGAKGAAGTAGTASIESLLSEEALTAAAWAMRFDTVYYVRLRSIVPQKLGLRLYEKNVKAHIKKLSQEIREGRVSGSGRGRGIGRDNFMSLSGNANINSPDDLEPLVLTGADTTGLCVPRNWRVDDNGITFIDSDGFEQQISSDPIFIKARLLEVDRRDRKLEVAFREEDSSYSSLIAPRADMRNKYKIINYANAGLDVESDTASLLAKYLTAMENANKQALPFTRCISRAGWIKDEFVPIYTPNGKVLFQDDEDNTLAGIHTAGNEALWLALAFEIRKLPFARAFMAASFASPLLSKLQQRNIYYHSWANSKSGKTAALKFALSVWGDPNILMKTYSSTMVGLERKAAIMKHLPYGLDEMQNINKKLSLNDVVYTLGNGFGKVRGKANGGTRTTERWNNVILSTGEQPITADESMDGMYTRVLEVYAKPIPDEELGHEVHQIVEANYGFAGEKFINFVIKEILSTANPIDQQETQQTSQATQIHQADADNADNADNADDMAEQITTGDGAETATADEGTQTKTPLEIAKEYAQADKNWQNNLAQAKKSAGAKAGRLFDDLETIISNLGSLYGRTDPKIRDISIIALGDYYASLAVFGLSEEDALAEAVSLGSSLLENQIAEEHKDNIDHAWDYICGWVVENKHKFIEPAATTTTSSEIYGKFLRDDRGKDAGKNGGGIGSCYVITGRMTLALKNAGFKERKCIKGFAERGYIGTFEEDGKPCYQPSRSIEGHSIRVYVLNLPKTAASDQEEEQEGLAFLD